MVLQKYKNGNAFISWLLVATLLLQSLCFPVHTAHATEPGEAKYTPSETSVTINEDSNTITVCIGSGIALRLLSAKVNEGDFLGLNLRVKLTGDINLTALPVQEEGKDEIEEVSNAFAALYNLTGSDEETDSALLDALLEQLIAGDTSWTPMGSTDETSFIGSFDGCGYTISGLHVVVQADEDTYEIPPFCGLIGVMVNSCVQNLTVDGTISINIPDTSNLAGSMITGGMVAGGAVNSFLDNCSARGTITATSNADDLSVNIGGLIGMGFDSSIINCSNEADIAVTNALFVGGIIGMLTTEPETAESVVVPCIANCYSVGTISGSSDKTSFGTVVAGGGLAGYAAASFVNNYFDGTIYLSALTDDFGFIDPVGTGSIGALVGILSNFATLANQDPLEVELSLNIRYNYFPITEIPEDPVDWYSLIDSIAFGCANVSSTFRNNIRTAFTNLQVATPMALETGTVYDPWNVRLLNSRQELRVSLNNQLLLLKLMIMQHLDALAESPWSDLIEKLNGEQVQVMCWSVGENGYPVQNTCTYESAGTHCKHCGRGEELAKTTYDVFIADADQLFSLATAVNVAGEQLSKIDLSVRLTADIDLAGKQWTPMGSLSKPFTGNFDGYGYAISNLYIDIYDDLILDDLQIGSSFVEVSKQAGFIGCLIDGGVQNLTVHGMEAQTPSISVYTSGTIYLVGMIAGYTKNALINNCMATGSISLIGTDLFSAYAAGTIEPSSDELIAALFAYGSMAGGLVGEAARSIIINCGSSADVHAENISVIGGLAGLSATMEDGLAFCLLNSYAIGKLTGYVTIAGGLVGATLDSVVNNYFAGEMDLEFMPLDLNNLSQSTYASTSTDALNAFGLFGTITGAFTNDDPFTSATEDMDLVAWYNYLPDGYVPHVTYTYSGTEEPLTFSKDYALTKDTFPAVGYVEISNRLLETLEEEAAAGRVLTPYKTDIAPDTGAYSIADPAALRDALNGNLEFTNGVIAEHLSCLRESPWSDLIAKLNGEQVRAIPWILDSEGYPAHDYIAPESTSINSVEITWGNMIFVYIPVGESGSWHPYNEDSDLITVTNCNKDNTMRATISYTPNEKASGIQDVTANLVDIRANPGVLDAVLSSHHNLAAQAVELDVSPLPESLDPESIEYHIISARLQLTGAPLNSLNYTPIGTITITISKPETEIYTWEHTHSDADNRELHWVVQIIGCGNSQIPGSTVKAAILPRDPAPGSIMVDHQYSYTDMLAGITVSAAYHDPSRPSSDQWVQWTVPQGSLEWSEDKVKMEDGKVVDVPYWTYTMPAIVPGTDNKDYYAEPIELGSRNWTYYINYSSTAILTDDQQGVLGAMNRVSITENGGAYHEIEGWYRVEHTEAHGNIVPFKSFVYDATSGEYYVKWDIAAIIPGLKKIKEGDPDQNIEPVYEKANYDWYIMDYLNVYDGYTKVGSIENGLGDKELTTVTAKYLKQGVEMTKEVPHIDDLFAKSSSERDKYFCAWDYHWGATDGAITYGKHIDILCRCYCTESTCHLWGTSGCSSIAVSDDDDAFCHCWTAPESVTLTFSYMTPYDPVYDVYYGTTVNGNYTLVNKAELWRSAERLQGSEGWTGILVDILDVSFQIKNPTTITPDIILPESDSGDTGNDDNTT